MTAVIARLILAMLILPATGAVFLLSFVLFVARSGGPPSTWAVLMHWAVVYTFIATYWILLWRSTVKWTAARVQRTALAGVLALGSGLAFAAALVAITGQIPHQIALLMGGAAVPIAWVLATVLLWRETAAERVERLSRLVGAGASVVCPVCGYNLSGLREARCPECGGSFTLDELAATQPQRDEHPAEL